MRFILTHAALYTVMKIAQRSVTRQFQVTPDFWRKILQCQLKSISEQLCFFRLFFRGCFACRFFYHVTFAFIDSQSKARFATTLCGRGDRIRTCGLLVPKPAGGLSSE